MGVASLHAHLPHGSILPAFALRVRNHSQLANCSDSPNAVWMKHSSDVGQSDGSLSMLGYPALVCETSIDWDRHHPDFHRIFCRIDPVMRHSMDLAMCQHCVLTYGLSGSVGWEPRHLDLP